MRKLLIVIVVLVAFSIPFSVFAATSETTVAKNIRGFCGIDTSDLSDQQKADMLESWEKLMETKKETVNDMVENKIITKEEGNEMIEQIDDMIKYREENGFDGSFGNTGNCLNDSYKSDKGFGRGCKTNILEY